MKNAIDVRVGHVIRCDGKACRVLSQVVRGTGKSAKTVHLKIKSLIDGNMHEKNIRGDEKIEDVELNRVKMQYLYKDDNAFVFMNNETYEQFPISENVIGKQSIFLKENSEIDVMFEGDQALSIDFPKVVELKVASTPAAVKGNRDSTFKEAELENGLKVLVPQFVKEGDAIRLDVETMMYMDRVTTKSMGGGTPIEKGKEKEKEKEKK
jgi:elongation factor P